MHSNPLTTPDDELPQTVKQLQKLEFSLHNGLLANLESNEQKHQFLQFRRQVEIKRRQLESLRLEQISTNFRVAAADLRESIAELRVAVRDLEEKTDAIAFLASISQVAVNLAALVPGI